jgi:hypothetical protein
MQVSKDTATQLINSIFPDADNTDKTAGLKDRVEVVSELLPLVAADPETLRRMTCLLDWSNSSTMAVMTAYFSLRMAQTAALRTLGRKVQEALDKGVEHRRQDLQEVVQEVDKALTALQKEAAQLGTPEAVPPPAAEGEAWWHLTDLLQLLYHPDFSWQALPEFQEMRSLSAIINTEDNTARVRIYKQKQDLDLSKIAELLQQVADRTRGTPNLNQNRIAAEAPPQEQPPLIITP